MKKIVIGIFTLFILMMTGCGSNKEENLPPIDTSQYSPIEDKNNSFENLCVPTQMTKIGDEYFIVDCYHNQIIYSTVPNAPLTQWKVLTSDIIMGHSICSDGVIYVCDDTENNRLLVFAKAEEAFVRLDSIEGVGSRPHYVLYNEDNGLFYVISSLTSEVYLYKRKTGTYELEFEKVVKLPELENTYIRSMSIIDGDLCYPASNGTIYFLDADSFKIKSSFSLRDYMGGPVQISKIGGYYYLTISTDNTLNTEYATIVRAKNPEDFYNEEYETLKDMFCSDGTPYVISAVDEDYYLAWHSEDGKNCMWKFNVDENEDVINIERVFENNPE